MIDYIEANCIVPPLNSHPEYDEDSDTWDVWFEESEGWNPYGLERELICIPLDTLDEAKELIHKSEALAYHEEANKENQESS